MQRPRIGHDHAKSAVTFREMRKHGTDRYRRTLGRVYQGEIDVNAEMIKSGMAWVYRKYSTDQSLYPMEAKAKEQTRGLWADPEPVPPWEWRRRKR